VRLVLAAVVLCACSHPPAKRPPPEEIPIEGTKTFAGIWLTNDDLDWGYRLQIVADGRLVLHVDRGKLGPCDQAGRLVQGDGPSTFVLTLTKDSCSKTGPTGGQLAVGVKSYTGQQLTLAYAVGENTVQRTYQRDPQSVQ
jgi:hypothetical protein